MTTNARYCPSSSSTSSAAVIVVVGLSIISDLGVICTVKYPRKLVEMLARDMGKELSCPGEEEEGGAMTTVMTTTMTTAEGGPSYPTSAATVAPLFSPPLTLPRGTIDDVWSK